MRNKAKKLLLRAIVPLLVSIFIVLPGALIAGLLSSGYTMMSVAWARPNMASNWVGLFSNAVVVGLFFCFIAAQLLLVKRNARRRHSAKV